MMPHERIMAESPHIGSGATKSLYSPAYQRCAH